MAKSSILNCSIKYKPRDIHESKWCFSWTFTPAKVVMYQSTPSSELIGFLTHRTNTPRNFRAFQTSLKFEFLVYKCSTLRHFCSAFCLVFQNRTKPFARFTIWGSTPGFHWQDRNVYLIDWPSCLVDVWKHFIYCWVLLILCFSVFSIHLFAIRFTLCHILYSICLY